MDNLKSKTIHSVFWSAVERYSVQGVQFILGLIMARLLTPHDYGLIAMLAIFMSISQIFIDGGFSTALIQRKERTKDDYSTAFYINLSMSILFYGILFVSAPWIADFYDQPLLIPITRVYSLNLIINSFVSIQKTKLTISLDFKTQSKISFLVALLSGAIGVSCAFNGLGVWALVVQMLASAVLNVAITSYFVRWFPHFSFSKKSFHSLFAFGSKLLVAQLISTIYSNIYTLIVGKKFSSDSLGYYSRADQFCGYANSNITGVLSRVAFPVLSQIHDDERLLRIYKKYIQTSALLVFPIMLGVGGVAKPLILLLLTAKWANTILLLQILCFAYLFDCIIIINLNLIYVKGRSDYVLRLEIVKKMIAFIILIISLFYNLVGICIGRVIYSFIALYLNTYYTKKLLNYGFAKQMKEIFPYLAFSIIIFIESFSISNLKISVLLSLILSLILCPLTYIVLCEVSRNKAYIVMKDLIISKCRGYLRDK